MGKSLFQKLCQKHKTDVTVLKTQYRMCQDILDLSNSIVYNNQMKSGMESVATQVVEFPHQIKAPFEWLEQVKARAVTFLKTDLLVQKIKHTER